ncbi:MAG: hypothetical protein R3A13_10560 [Bdellovibrionota bacterium]
MHQRSDLPGSTRYEFYRSNLSQQDLNETTWVAMAQAVKDSKLTTQRMERSLGLLEFSSEVYGSDHPMTFEAVLLAVEARDQIDLGSSLLRRLTDGLKTIKRLENGVVDPNPYSLLKVKIHTSIARIMASEDGAARQGFFGIRDALKHAMEAFKTIGRIEFIPEHSNRQFREAYTIPFDSVQAAHTLTYMAKLNILSGNYAYAYKCLELANKVYDKHEVLDFLNLEDKIYCKAMFARVLKFYKESGRAAVLSNQAVALVPAISPISRTTILYAIGAKRLCSFETVEDQKKSILDLFAEKTGIPSTFDAIDIPETSKQITNLDTLVAKLSALRDLEADSPELLAQYEAYYKQLEQSLEEIRAGALKNMRDSGVPLDFYILGASSFIAAQITTESQRAGFLNEKKEKELLERSRRDYFRANRLFEERYGINHAISALATEMLASFEKERPEDRQLEYTLKKVLIKQASDKCEKSIWHKEMNLNREFRPVPTEVDPLFIPIV